MFFLMENNCVLTPYIPAASLSGMPLRALPVLPEISLTIINRSGQECPNPAPAAARFLRSRWFLDTSSPTDHAHAGLSDVAPRHAVDHPQRPQTLLQIQKKVAALGEIVDVAR
jgi:hypothetical protein